MRKQILIIIASLILVASGLSGCFGLGSIDDNNYYGEYVDLNSQVTNSILGTLYPATNTIVVVDEDAFGRRLFACRNEVFTAYSKMGGSGGEVFGIFVTQKTDEEYVYFYPDYNFIIYPYERNPGGEEPSYEDELTLLSQNYAISNDIEKLKQKNDWEKPFDESMCVEVKVSRTDRDYESRLANKPLISDEARQKAYKQVLPQAVFYPGLFYYLTSDEYDRHIYFFRGLDENDEYTKSYVVMFNKDGSFDSKNGIMEITDLWNYQDDLKAFKERNGWDCPIDINK